MDVYSAWCGPCKAVVGLFRRLKNEIGDDLLRYGLVRTENMFFQNCLIDVPYFSGQIRLHRMPGALQKSSHPYLPDVLSEGVEF